MVNLSQELHSHLTVPQKQQEPHRQELGQKVMTETPGGEEKEERRGEGGEGERRGEGEGGEGERSCCVSAGLTRAPSAALPGH